jgi:UPF0755 protein
MRSPTGPSSAAAHDSEATMTLSRGSRWFLAFGLLAVAGIAGGLWWLDTNVFGEEEVVPGQPVDYTVARGQTVRAVGEDLAELGVIRSPVRFRLAADQAELAATLQPGSFELETGMSNEAAIGVLAAGPLAPPSIRFTVPEGLTVEQTLARLDTELEGFSADDFRAVLDARREAGAPLPGLLQLPSWVPEPGDTPDELEPFEGLLFPETYELPDDVDALQVLQRMVEQLAIEMDAIDEDGVTGAAELGLDRYETLVLASLIERETRVDAERGTIAGVIANRLEIGQRLQIDATVVYAMGGEPTDIVLLEDLEIDSPHNTYRIDGLPPTPIAGVGRASLQAAADPDQVSSLFYVLDPACDGSHVFADTAEQHQTNVEAFRAAGRCGAGDG